MVFSSLVFLYLFLPLTLLLYYAAPRRLRNPVLLVMSLLFYGWGEPRGVVIMLITCSYDLDDSRYLLICRQLREDETPEEMEKLYKNGNP